MISRTSRAHLLFCAVLLAVLCAGVAGLLALGAAPAQAFPEYAHGGLPPGECDSCHLPTGGVTNDACTFCHGDFQPPPQKDCWDCHEPGADTSALSSSSSACSQQCHLYSDFDKSYTAPYTHGPLPHAGASGFGPSCLDCHGTSAGVFDPGDSPHHDAVDQAAPSCTDCHDGVVASFKATHDGVGCESCHDGMNIPPRPATCTSCHSAATFGGADCAQCHSGQIHDTTPDAGTCLSCHSGYQRHAGDVNCTRCHTGAAAFHHDTQKAKARTCRSCHPRGHAGARVANSRCASCHRGSAPAARPRAQHSSKVTKQRNCSQCHTRGLHAAAYGAKTTCRTCHRSRFHASQARPGSGVCLSCHSSARFHSGGFRCTVCHRSVVHDRTPAD